MVVLSKTSEKSIQVKVKQCDFHRTLPAIMAGKSNTAGKVEENMDIGAFPVFSTTGKCVKTPFPSKESLYW